MTEVPSHDDQGVPASPSDPATAPPQPPPPAPQYSPGGYGAPPTAPSPTNPPPTYPPAAPPQPPPPAPEYSPGGYAAPPTNPPPTNPPPTYPPAAPPQPPPPAPEYSPGGYAAPPTNPPPTYPPAAPPQPPPPQYSPGGYTPPPNYAPGGYAPPPNYPPPGQGPPGAPPQYPPGGYGTNPGQYPPAGAWGYGAPGTYTPRPNYAGYGARLGGYLIDGVVLFVVSIVVRAIFGSVGSITYSSTTNGVYRRGSISVLVFILEIVITLLYGAFFCGSARGQTPGMMAVGVRAVDADSGGPIGFGRAFGRGAFEYLMIVVFFLPWVLDLLFPLWDPQHQTLHDKVTRTIVVRA